MSYVCQFCSYPCTSGRGLTQHINRNDDCKDQQEALLGVSGGFCPPTTTTTAGGPRRSTRNRKPDAVPKAAPQQFMTLEVPDIDVGSLDAPEAEDMETDANT